MQIFITGASGFIGGAITERLKNAHRIVALSRSEKSDIRIRKCGAEPVHGELGNIKPGDLQGCEVAIHCAAFVEAWGARQQFWRINVEGTTQFLEAAQQAGVRRFIHVSTEAVLFYGQHMRDIDESYPYPDKTPFLYSETKAEAERRVLAAHAPEAGFETLALRPRLVWGPGDMTILPEVKKMAESGRFVWIDGGHARTSTTHVENFAHAVSLALTKGRGGEAYFITDDEILTFREFLTQYMATAKVDMPDKSLPGWLVRGLAAGVEGLWHLLRIRSEPPLLRFAVAGLSRDCTLRIDKARKTIGYAPQLSVAEGLRQLKMAGVHQQEK